MKTINKGNVYNQSLNKFSEKNLKPIWHEIMKKKPIKKIQLL